MVGGMKGAQWQTLSAHITLVITLVRAIVCHHHGTCGNHSIANRASACFHPRALDRILMHFHVCIQLLPIVKFLDTLFAFKRISVNSIMC